MLAVFVVEFESVPVPFLNQGLAVGPGSAAAVNQLAGIIAQAHRGAFVFNFLLLRQEVDNRMERFWDEFGGVWFHGTEDMAGKLDDHDMQPQAQPQVGYLVFPGVSGRLDFTFDTPLAEATRDDDPLGGAQQGFDIVLVKFFRVHPEQVEFPVIMESGVIERLTHRVIGIVQLDVFTHQGNINRVARGLDALHHFPPLPQFGRTSLDAELFNDNLSQAGLLEYQGDFVYRFNGGQGDHRLALDITEEGYLVRDSFGDGIVTAADDDVRLDTDAAQLVNAVLGGLGLQLHGGVEVGEEGHVDVEHVVPADFVSHLPDSLQEGLPLNITHGTAHLDEDDVGSRVLGQFLEPLFNLVDQVGHDLDGAPQEVPPPFLGNDGAVNLPRGYIGIGGELGVDKAFVVAQIEVGLGAVLGDEYLAVLVGGHRARIDVEIRVQLLYRNGNLPAF